MRCNCCGQHLPELTPVDHTDSHELEVVGGYCTTFPGDLTALRAVVCSPCLKAWVRTFRVAPEMGDRLEELAAERAIEASERGPEGFNSPFAVLSER